MISDRMLVEISKADRGMDDWEHLHSLRHIRDTVIVSSPMDFEVLSLVRWSRPLPHDIDGHIQRAFCCATLLRAGQESYHFGKDALIPLIDSSLVIGEGLPKALASFVTWQIPRMPADCAVRPAFAFGLVAVAMLSLANEFATSEIETIAGFAESAELDFRDPTGACTIDMFEGSLVDLSPYGLRNDMWQMLAVKVLELFAGVPRRRERLSANRKALSEPRKRGG